MKAYHCEDCDFKTELQFVLKQHINKHHGPQRESSEETSSDETSSEDSSKENYGCAKYYFEPNLSLKLFQHTSACTETKEKPQSVNSLKESATYSSDIKQTDEILYYCDKCLYKCKIKSNLIRHIRVFHSHRGYACDKCPFKTRYKSTLKIHINRIHLDEQAVECYKCQKCPFRPKQNVV
ncbi:hypothetical protein Zmor_017383 [Zophobas morio]|uniref:C2H2-type domain-containing protein n=1 Tax=Zophobas morio TaxID=2755281 RepID=A0AA38I9L5_9CUCU|nr:hypothetical protein Zmor_017383 [Zophobas morio]